MGSLVAGLVIGVVVAGLLRWRGRSVRVALGAAAAAILLSAILADYGWYPLKAARLPASETVATITAEASPLRPWTFAVPSVVRFVALDTEGARPHGLIANQRIVPLIFYGRREAMLRVDVLFECRRLERAPLVEGTAFDESGTVQDPQWEPSPVGDPVTRRACELDLAFR